MRGSTTRVRLDVGQMTRGICLSTAVQQDRGLRRSQSVIECDRHPAVDASASLWTTGRARMHGAEQTVAPRVGMASAKRGPGDRSRLVPSLERATRWMSQSTRYRPVRRGSDDCVRSRLTHRPREKRPVLFCCDQAGINRRFISGQTPGHAGQWVGLRSHQRYPTPLLGQRVMNP